MSKIQILCWSIGIRWVVSSSKYWLFEQRYSMPMIHTTIYLWSLESFLCPVEIKYKAKQPFEYD
jgi:hypothetical protein